MTPAIPELLATSLEAAGKLDDAIALLERGGSRRTPRQSILLKLWMLRKNPATPAESGASSPKADTPETPQKPVAPTAEPGAPEPPKPAPSADPPAADSDRPPAPPWQLESNCRHKWRFSPVAWFLLSGAVSAIVPPARCSMTVCSKQLSLETLRGCVRPAVLQIEQGVHDRRNARGP